jgi:hypothetical protein
MTWRYDRFHLGCVFVALAPFPIAYLLLDVVHIDPAGGRFRDMWGMLRGPLLGMFFLNWAVGPMAWSWIPEKTLKDVDGTEKGNEGVGAECNLIDLL